MKEMYVWLGLGPFEAFLHSVGGLVFVLMLTLQIEHVITISWHLIFVPLYISLALDSYFNILQLTRIIAYVIDTKNNLIFAVFHSVLLAIRIGIFLYAEIETANVLNSKSNVESLLPPITLFILYLSFRLIPIMRVIKSSDNDN